MALRIERDSLGEKPVPAEAYYGVQTQRALENFPISNLRFHQEMIIATVRIKKAAAETNMSLGRLGHDIGRAIVGAADEVLAGQFRDQFVVDVFQAGAGTSYNMNVNEVLANRAAEILGYPRGDYSVVHPNDHVNMGQSTNDVFPTSIRLAALAMVETRLVPVLIQLQDSLESKARGFDGILKAGRTHLQDAVPIRLGQEFGAYARAVEKCRIRTESAAGELRELAIGGTAIGTGLNAGRRYAREMVRRLALATNQPLRAGENLIELTQSTDAFLHLSAALRTLATDLIRIANDLRLMSSGPETGLAEIRLPAVQPGSSIMPGKVNPVMAEAVDMVGFQVIGCDAVITAATQAGQLELNVMTPVIAFNLLFGLEILSNVVQVFDQKCIRGVEANEPRCREYAEHTLGLATALNPYIGYAQAAKVEQEALATGKSIRQVIEEKGLLTEEELDRILSPWTMTEPAGGKEESGHAEESGTWPREIARRGVETNEDPDRM